MPISPMASSPPSAALNALPIMVERIVSQFHPYQVILFGSQARAEAGPDSDIDLLIVVDDLNSQRKINLITAIRDALDDLMVPKDIIVATCQELADYRHIIGHIIRTALQEGEVLYDRPIDHSGN